MIDLDTIWVVGCAGLVLLMQPGFMCLESGLTRSKNSINVAVKNLADLGISVCFFWVFGFALMFGTSWAGWIGTSGFFLNFDSDPKLAAFFIFQTMFCGTATTIVSGALAERLKFQGYVAIAFIISGLIYPLYGHWVWNGANGEQLIGWLAQLGFIDFAGSSAVHSVGGGVSLAALLVVGPRTGWTSDKIHGSNLPFSVLGVMLLWVGWMGFNGGSTFALTNQVPIIIAHTIMAGAAGMMSAALLGWWQQRLLRPETLINGSLAGLVSITASCHAVSTPMAVLIGAIGGWVMMGTIAVMRRCGIDDGVDAVALHGASGVWGTLAVAFFGDLELLGTGLSRHHQLAVQAFGALICCLWAFGFTYLLLKNINRFFPFRVSIEEEDIGLNVSEHQAKTEVYELFRVMDEQRLTQNFSLRVPEDPFTEAGKIARRYNQVMASLESYAQQLKTLNASLENTVAKRTNDLVQANAELKSLNTELQRLDRLKDEFLANTSHELRTPLNGIIGLSEYLLEDEQTELSASASDNLLMIANSGRRLFNLVNDILDFARVLHDNLSLHLKPVGLHVVTDVVLTLCRPLIENRGLRLVNHVPKSLPLMLADENRLQQILYNLVGNAIKFTSEGRIEIFADIEQVDDRRYVKVTVADTGIGIAKNKYEHIFESFEQAEGYTTREYGGLGLGLAVTKKLVELHDGSIWVDSVVGQGSRFYFTLPVCEQCDVQFDVQSDNRQVSQVSALVDAEAFVSPTQMFWPFDTADRVKGDRLLISPSNSPALSGRLPSAAASKTTRAQSAMASPSSSGANDFRVLIVDDDPVNLQVLNNYLGMQRYQVAKTSSGQQALALLDKGYRPDLVVLDVMMPRMSGYEVTRTIRAQWTRDELPIVLLTAKNTLEDEVVGLRAGANDYLTKPIVKEGLLARIETQLSLRQESLERQIAQAERIQFAQALDLKNADLLAAKEALARQNQTLEQQVAERTKVLAERERQLSTLLKNLPGMAYRCINDPRWPKTFVSEGCMAITGYPPEALIHPFPVDADDSVARNIINYETLIHPDDRAFVWESVQNALKKKTPYQFVYRLRLPKSGEIKWVWEQGQGIWNKNGKLMFLEGFIADISERVRAEKKLEASNRDLQRLLEEIQVTQSQLKLEKEKSETANLAKSKFLANMSHELRTPLNSILGFTQLLQQDIALNAEPKIEQRNRVQIINRSAEHLLSLINNILDISKIEAGKTTLMKGEFNLHILLTDIVNMFSLQVQRKGLALTLERSLDVPKFISTDEGKLRQILTNLVANAIKFTDDGSVTVTVQIAESTAQKTVSQVEENATEAATDEHTVDKITTDKIVSESKTVSESKIVSESNLTHQLFLQFSVQDTGPGIALDEISQLFVPFEQTATGRALQQGSGLGLPISQQYARLMGGDISVSSRVGSGSCFELLIPISQDDVTADINARQALGAAQKITQSETSLLTSEQLLNALNQMPDSWIAALDESARHLKGRAVRQLISQVPAEQAVLARSLSELAESYQFEEIIKVIRQLNRPENK
ncbi:MAG: ammonium transporter [Phormidesmis sp.]